MMKPRIEAIEKPRGLMLRLAYWLSRRQLGAVIGPLKVVYARSPRIARTGLSMARTLESLSLDRELVLLVMTQGSMWNGCGFCADLHRAQAVQERIGLDRFRALEDFRESPHFSERERAALAYTEEATRNGEVSDASFAELQRHFDDTQIVELTWVNALNGFYNRLAVPLGIESDGLAELALSRAA